MKLHRLLGKTGYTTFGCMWEKGRVKAGDTYVCKNPDGTAVPLQSRITAYWPDGSVKWSAHTADAEKLDENIEVTPVSAAEPLETKGLSVEKTETPTLCATAGIR